MSNLVFISGDFCSGSTLLFTLFRKTEKYYCLYEPLHENLLEYLIWPLRVYEHHFFVENYFSEYKGFRNIQRLFKPQWGNKGLYLPPEAEANDLYRYLCYIIGASFGRQEKVMLQFNRATFRLGWLKARFPDARIVHIYRDMKSQWNSNLRRVQEHFGREDVGQEDVMFNGFNIATWCEDLKKTFPELDASNFQTGYDRFCRLWELSRAENQRYADISVDYRSLTHDFETTWKLVENSVGFNSDIAVLKRFIIPPEKQDRLSIHKPGLRNKAKDLIDKAGRKYAKARVKTQMFLNKKSN